MEREVVMGNEFLLGINRQMYGRYLEAVGLLTHLEREGICKFQFDFADIPAEAHNIFITWEANSSGEYLIDSSMLIKLVAGTSSVLVTGNTWALSFELYYMGDV